MKTETLEASSAESKEGSRETSTESKSKSVVDFRPGDIVRVHYKIRESGSERVQLFEGIVIRRRGSGISETFTLRKISFGVGVERIFPFHSPAIQKIERVQPGKVRRAKLYYLRKNSSS